MHTERVWQSGDVTLYLGDCRKIVPQLVFGEVGVVITDPPYLEGDFSDLLPEFKRLTNVVVITPGKLESFNWIRREKPFWEYCWRMSSKSKGGSACLHIGWEPILAYAPPLRPIGNDVLTFTQKIWNSTNGIHEWPKPQELFDFLVARWVADESTVLDAFCGSGTTGISCVRLGRKFIGIDINEKHFETSIKRISEAQQQMRMF